ncbi:LuxR C-terminal-related transcriptional regulator [Leekyejoonella antrihumi]|uniref:response regulator transcription factor n=1 Tax=Leekyejoonella antrihumi TaxID=1660198 RepID=UPI0016473B43
MLFPQLTDRERDILEHVASGERTRTIAAALHLSPKTVSNYLTSTFTKLEVAGRSEVGRTSMRERTAELGGTFEVDPTPGGCVGSTCCCHWPEQRRLGAASVRSRRCRGRRVTTPAG